VILLTFIDVGGFCNGWGPCFTAAFPNGIEANYRYDVLEATAHGWDVSATSPDGMCSISGRVGFYAVPFSPTNECYLLFYGSINNYAPGGPCGSAFCGTAIGLPSLNEQVLDPFVCEPLYQRNAVGSACGAMQIVFTEVLE
jgi:hypothetical protein